MGKCQWWNFNNAKSRASRALYELFAFFLLEIASHLKLFRFSFDSQTILFRKFPIVDTFRGTVVCTR